MIFSSDSVLLCLASEHYNPDEYIRDYDKFVELVYKDDIEIGKEE